MHLSKTSAQGRPRAMKAKGKGGALKNLLFSDDEHRAAARLVEEVSARYHESLDHRPVYPALDRAALRALMAEPLPQEGAPLEAVMETFERVIQARNAAQAAQGPADQYHPRTAPRV